MTPGALSRELRLGSGSLLRRRRQVVSLSLVAAGSMMPITLYQMGVIPHLPAPPPPLLKTGDGRDVGQRSPGLLARRSHQRGLESGRESAGEVV